MEIFCIRNGWIIQQFNTNSPSNFTDKSTSPNSSKPKVNNLTKLKIISLNCCSIRSQSKRTSLAAVLSTYDIDVVLGCKSHLDQSYFSSELLPVGYTIFRKDRIKGGRGVFIGIKKSLAILEEPKLNTDCEIIWIKLHLTGRKTFYICSYYRPPDHNINAAKQIFYHAF